MAFGLFEAHLGESLVSGHGRVACAERYACNDGSARFRVGVEFTQLSDRCRDLLDHYLARLIGQSRR